MKSNYDMRRAILEFVVLLVVFVLVQLVFFDDVEGDLCDDWWNCNDAAPPAGFTPTGGVPRMTCSEVGELFETVGVVRKQGSSIKLQDPEHWARVHPQWMYWFTSAEWYWGTFPDNPIQAGVKWAKDVCNSMDPAYMKKLMPIQDQLVEESI